MVLVALLAACAERTPTPGVILVFKHSRIFGPVDPIPALLREFEAIPWADIAAASMLASLPMALLTLALQRHLVQGVIAGAVKD